MLQLTGTVTYILDIIKFPTQFSMLSGSLKCADSKTLKNKIFSCAPLEKIIVLCFYILFYIIEVHQKNSAMALLYIRK